MLSAQQQDDWTAQFQQFCRDQPLHERSINGHRWQYIDCGVGATLLVLPGGLAVAQTAFRYIIRLAPMFRVLAPTYPSSYRALGPLVDDLAHVLRTEGIDKVHVIGGSYSGLIAQWLLRRYPTLIASLVLSDTGVPRPERARWMGWLQSGLLSVPWPILRLFWRLSMALYVSRLTAQRLFWRHYFATRINAMTRAEWLSHLAIWRDFDQLVFAPLPQCPPLLIIEAERDGVFGPAEQRRLRELYPTARWQTFANCSHGAALAQMDNYITVIEQFLISGTSDATS